MGDGRRDMEKGVRAIAAFECLKGLLAMLASGLLLFCGRLPPEQLAGHLLALLHLNPARHYPQLLLAAADRVSSTQLTAAALVLAAYAGLRFAEAWGLWRLRPWASWLGIVSGMLYLPLEAAELLRTPALSTALVLVLNLVVVGWLLVARQRASHGLPS